MMDFLERLGVLALYAVLALCGLYLVLIGHFEGLLR